ncbi:MAG: hypothetical protein HZB91_01460 [Elusimicrobia bacterium]|nr:hypothetical protein [Elusimicrobiota bacterium]
MRPRTAIYLRSQRYPLPSWPGDDLAAAGEIRVRYLAALRDADQGDFGPLTGFTKGLLPSRQPRDR